MRQKKPKMKKLLIITILISIVSCKSQENESKELVKKANNFFITSKLTENIKIDSCLKIINKAIEIDDENFNAYYNKTRFLTLKKDIKESIKNNQKMVELRPNQPLWKIQRGLFFDIDGNKIEANKNYKIGITEYEKLLEIEKQLAKDFNFRMEYLTALETSGNIKKAAKEMSKIENDFPNNEILKFYKTEYKTKAEVIEMWKNGTE